MTDAVIDQAKREEPRPCDLCGLPIEGAPYMLETPERRYSFCCDGCLGIFQVLHDLNAVAPPAPPSAKAP